MHRETFHFARLWVRRPIPRTAIVELLGVDHSGLVRFSTDGTYGTVVAEYGRGMQTRGIRVPFQDAPAERALVERGQLIVEEDVATATDLGPVRDILLDLGIRSILIVPIASHDRILGSFSLDTLERREFSRDDRSVCLDLARLISVAMERTEIFERDQKQSVQIEAIRTSTLAISSTLNPADTLKAIVHNAAWLLNASDAGIYLYNPQEQKLRLAAVAKHAEKRLDTVLALGEGMAGNLVATRAPFLTTSDYSTYPGRSQKYNRAPAFGAVLEVPIPGADQYPQGVLFVTSPPGREYQSYEIELLRWFADHAAIALRNAQLVEGQQRGLQLLLEATHVVVDAEDVSTGLKKLAELIVRFMGNSFCRILLMQDDGNYLLPIAAHAAPGFQWASAEQPVAISQWPRLRELLEADKPQLLRYSNERTRPHMEQFSELLQLPTSVQSLLLIPLKFGDRLVGVINIGEMRSEERSPFTEAKQRLAHAIAGQITVLVDRLRQHELGRRHTRLVSELEVFSGYLVAVKEPDRLLQEFLRLSTVLFPGTVGALFRNHRSLEELELLDAQGLPNAPKGQRVTYHDPLLGPVAREGTAGSTSTLNGLDGWPFGATLFGGLGVRRVVATPLKIGSDVEFILTLGDPSGQWFRSEPDLGILERLTTRAASALATSRLIHPDPRLTEQLSRLQPIGDYMQRADRLDPILHAFLTGVTAGYGLGFNRAAVFLADERREYLVGKKAIGDVSTWTDHIDPLNGFTQFVRARELGELPASAVDQAVTRLRVPVVPK